MKLKSLFLALTALALVACDKTVTVKNGEVPADLLPLAQNLVGSYQGQFDGLSNGLDFSLDGNKLVVKARADLLGRNCATAVGALKSLTVESKDKSAVAITGATFELNPGSCREIEGRELDLSRVGSAAGTIAFHAEVFAGYRTEVERIPGYVACSVDRWGRQYCWQEPDRYRYYQVAQYLNGHFEKN